MLDYAHAIRFAHGEAFRKKEIKRNFHPKEINMSVNKCMLLGRLGQCPELKRTTNGNSVCNFTLATTDAWTDQAGNKNEKTIWHKIEAWGKLADNCNQFLKKGSQVFIEGKIDNRSWVDEKTGEKKYSSGVIAKIVQFLDPRENAGKNNSTNKTNFHEQKNVNASSQSNMQQQSFTQDDIPF